MRPEVFQGQGARTAPGACAVQGAPVVTEGIRCTEPLPRRELVPWRDPSRSGGLCRSGNSCRARSSCRFRGLVPVGTGACTVPLLRWCAPVAGLFPAVHPFSCDAPLSAVRGLPDIIPVRPPVRPSVGPSLRPPAASGGCGNGGDVCLQRHPQGGTGRSAASALHPGETLPKSNGHPTGESDVESIWQVF